MAFKKYYILVILVFITILSFPVPAKTATAEDLDVLAGWYLGQKLGYAGLGYVMNMKDIQDQSFQKAQVFADSLKVTIPPLPQKQADTTKNRAVILKYFLDTAEKAYGNALKAKGDKVYFTYQMSIRNIILAIIYMPGDSLGTTIGTYYTKVGPLSGLPKETWQPVVDKINAKVSYDDIKKAIGVMSGNVEAYVRKKAGI